MQCGFLTVPEDRAQPEGRSIQLAVAVFKARGADPLPDPVVWLDGGPGGETLGGTTEYFAGGFASELQERRDIVFFDQRGVGLSKPSLDCPEYTNALYETLNVRLSRAEVNARDEQALGACRDRLQAAGVNLAAYTSVASVADVRDLMAALGYQEWNVFGVSYGTRLALTMMRDAPQGVRSVILDSTYPPQVNRYVDLPEQAEQAFKTVFEGCANDPKCNAAYPNLEETFYHLVRSLNQKPVTIPTQNVFDGQSYDVLIDGEQVIGMLFTSLYITSMLPELPLIISEADAGLAQGETSALEYWAWVIFLFEGLSEGVYYSVECGEEAAFSTPEELLAAAEDLRPELRSYYADPAFLTFCRTWGSHKAEPRENQPVSSSIPTLILAGEYDPVTPPAYGRLAAETLSESYFFEFPGVGHAAFSQACPLQIITAFVENPAQAPDPACIATMAGPEFQVVQ